MNELHIDGNNYQEERKIITFPYIQNFQEQLSRIFKNSKLQIIFSIENTSQKKKCPTIKDKTQTIQYYL